MLNQSKGPAVHSLRAQADKLDYTREMRRTLENTNHLTVRQAEVSELIAEDGILTGVKTFSGAVYYCKAAVLATGTYLKARCIYGDVSNATGPNGLQAANHLTDSLKALGIEVRRYKTGTPARVDKRSIDFSKMEEQFGDKKVVPFSFSTDPKSVQKEQVSCWLTYTNEETHQIIKENLSRSPLFSGAIEGTGPRYCPSIEDKVVKFPDKNRHQIFVEPEGLYTNEMYLGGMSSSLPEDVQFQMYRTVPGLENVKIVRNAYAIEYDCIDSRQLQATLEFKEIKGLFSGGQFNGSSGYEEAAVQGFMAGVNASMKVLGRAQIVLDRSQAYIGVLIDDLVTKESHEPYRMMTSRAEYRLLLRQDNADIRLMGIGHEIGLISDEQFENLTNKVKTIDEEIKRLESTNIGASKDVQQFLEKNGSTSLKTGATLAELIRRPELDYIMLTEIDKNRPQLSEDVIEQVDINIKYEGYIRRQKQQVSQYKKLENKKLDIEFDYSIVKGLRREAIQKLNLYKPMSIGQASRISGVSPADISVLLVYLEQLRHQKKLNKKE
jgi:tRNA uridine 5-carboxymethylaminomethyl modification enzyme